MLKAYFGQMCGFIMFFYEYRRICFDYLSPFSSPVDSVCLRHIEITSPKQSRVFAFFPLPSTKYFLSTTKAGEERRIKAKHDKRPYRPFMPSVMTGNVRSLNNKIDELSSLSKFHSDYRQASIISLTEIWLTENTPSTYYDLDGFSLYRCDRDINSDKTCGGGVCTYINNEWCHRNNIHQVKKEASKDVELLTLSLRPFQLPREFTNVYVTTIYTPPDSNVENANNIIKKHVNDLMTKSPDCINILTGDFNNYRDINIPGLLQYVNCLTRGNATLDFFFVMSRTLILVPIGRSDHTMLQSLPKYLNLPVLKRSKPIKKCVRVLDESGLSALQGCFDRTDWSEFVQSCENVDELNDCVTDYINFCVDIQTREKNILY